MRDVFFPFLITIFSCLFLFLQGVVAFRRNVEWIIEGSIMDHLHSFTQTIGNHFFHWDGGGPQTTPMHGGTCNQTVAICHQWATCWVNESLTLAMLGWLVGWWFWPLQKQDNHGKSPSQVEKRFWNIVSPPTKQKMLDEKHGQSTITVWSAETSPRPHSNIFF